MNGDRTSDYEFALPPELIAQEPLADRASSRLMVVSRDSGRIEHRHFRDLAQLIPAGDLLVMNTTRVLRARLLGTRASGGRAEILLLKPRAEHGDVWEAMVSPGGKLKPGRMVHVGDDLDVEIMDVTERRTRLVRLHTSLSPAAALEQYGHVPLPPYITRADAPGDAERYQTVYAREPGSVAAPTAGLHFTPALLDELTRRGVRQAGVVLHVGAGTFKPVETDDPTEHVMHEETFMIPDETAAAVAKTRAGGQRVWAVGTTTVRTLESAAEGAGLESAAPETAALETSALERAADGGVLRARSGDTRLFIRPGFQFQVVDRLITNFHLPRSTLLMLVAAFAGYELTMHAYHEAVAERYRFFSYGDAMAVI